MLRNLPVVTQPVSRGVGFLACWALGPYLPHKQQIIIGETYTVRTTNWIYLLCTVLSTSYIKIHLIPRTMYQYAHYTDEEAGTQRAAVSFPKPHS